MKLFEVQGESKWMLVEAPAAIGKNVHMTHIEDLLFYEGYQGVKKALNHIDANRLIAAPDCGLGHLPRILVKKKLKIMVEAVKNF